MHLITVLIKKEIKFQCDPVLCTTSWRRIGGVEV